MAPAFPGCSAFRRCFLLGTAKSSDWIVLGVPWECGGSLLPRLLEPVTQAHRLSNPRFCFALSSAMRIKQSAHTGSFVACPAHTQCSVRVLAQGDWMVLFGTYPFFRSLLGSVFLAGGCVHKLVSAVCWHCAPALAGQAVQPWQVLTARQRARPSAAAQVLMGLFSAESGVCLLCPPLRKGQCEPR